MVVRAEVSSSQFAIEVVLGVSLTVMQISGHASVMVPSSPFALQVEIHVVVVVVGAEAVRRTAALLTVSSP